VEAPGFYLDSETADFLFHDLLSISQGVHPCDRGSADEEIEGGEVAH